MHRSKPKLPCLLRYSFLRPCRLMTLRKQDFVCSVIATPWRRLAPALMSSESSLNKIVLLGEGRVGKTSLLLRYTQDGVITCVSFISVLSLLFSLFLEFHEHENSTIKASFVEKRVNVGGRTVTLCIWDTAGLSAAFSLFFFVLTL